MDNCSVEYRSEYGRTTCLKKKCSEFSVWFPVHPAHVSRNVHCISDTFDAIQDDQGFCTRLRETPILSPYHSFLKVLEVLNLWLRVEPTRKVFNWLLWCLGRESSRSSIAANVPSPVRTFLALQPNIIKYFIQTFSDLSPETDVCGKGRAFRVGAQGVEQRCLADRLLYLILLQVFGYI